MKKHKRNQIPDIFALIDKFISGEILFLGKDRKKNTLKTYGTSKRSLLEFQKHEKYPVSYETINLDFFLKYRSFLKNHKKLSTNTIAQRIKKVKVFMNEAVELKYTTNLEFRSKRFNVSEEETDSVYLNQQEIIQLYNYDFSDNLRLDAVRDLFVFGCFVGLRYSDYSNVKPENIVNIDGEIFLRVITTKTATEVIIPCNQVVLQIFDKYSYRPNKLPKAISDVNFNKYIKEACRAAGLVQTGRLFSEPNKELCDCVSSHTARRSMVTNLASQKFDMSEIMKITGHTSKSIHRYNKLTKLDAAKKLSQHFKDNLSIYSLSKVS